MCYERTQCEICAHISALAGGSESEGIDGKAISIAISKCLCFLAAEFLFAEIGSLDMNTNPEYISSTLRSIKRPPLR